MKQGPEPTHDVGAERLGCSRINGGEEGLAAIAAIILLGGFGCLTPPLL